MAAADPELPVWFKSNGFDEYSTILTKELGIKHPSPQKKHIFKSIQLSLYQVLKNTMILDYYVMKKMQMVLSLISHAYTHQSTNSHKHKQNSK